MNCSPPVIKDSIRAGKALTLFAIVLPTLCGILGLVVDASMLRAQYLRAQSAADAAATAAASALYDGKSASAASTLAVQYVQQDNEMPNASVNVQIPPLNGPYFGQSGFVEVQVTLSVPTYFAGILGNSSQNTIKATAIAGSKPATAGAAVVVLDPSPPGISLPTLAGISLPSVPTNLGGLEVMGLGQLRVNGAVLVNTQWGGVDENGDPAGQPDGLRSAATCTPLLSLTRVAARDIRVVGGVDNPKNYGNYTSGKSSPLHANRRGVTDPFDSLPPPTVAIDPAHVSGTLKGGVAVINLPLIGLPTTLQPGVYDWIQVTGGNVIFKPGVYIIRGAHPLTGISLQIVGGQITANGVMFYVTNSAGYTPTSGLPDSANGNVTPPALTLGTVPPSVVINAGLLGSTFTPLSGTGSPYDGVLIYQSRSDRRIIVLATASILSTGTLSGTVYAKWGQVVFASTGSFDMRFVAGSICFANVLDVTLQPSQLLPPAQDVYLVQ